MLWLLIYTLLAKTAQLMASQPMPSHRLVRSIPRFILVRLMPRSILCVLLAVSLGGCSLWRDRVSNNRTVVEDATIDAASDLTNSDTQVRITVPQGWRIVRNNSRGSSDIYATYEPQELYVSVLSESNPVLDQFDIEDNAEQYRWLIEQELDRFEGETRTNLTALAGNPAVQYELRGVVDGVPVVYLQHNGTGARGSLLPGGWLDDRI